MRRTTFSATVAVSMLTGSSASQTSALDVLLSLAADASHQTVATRR